MTVPDGVGLEYVKTGPVATITIDRPERGNALTPAMRPVITALWADVRDDPAVRAVVVTGRGDRHFCTGVDLDGVAATGTATSGDGPAAEEIVWSPHHQHLWKPVICAVNGLVAGAGLHFVVDADIVVADERATFMDTHVNVGMVGAVENVGLIARAGLGAALRMTLSGRHHRMSAARAHTLGLVDELAPAGQARAVAQEIAADIAENSPAAVAASKQALWTALELPRSEAIEHAWALARQHWAHPDFREGPRAFAEKREPRWTVDR